MTDAAGPTNDALDELLAGPVADFVAARDALAKRLRTEGDRPAAAAVKKLRRPAVSAWALDQVARGQVDLITELLDVGAQLRAATSEAVRGDATDLRALRTGERAAVEAVVRAALAAASAAGHGPTDELRRRIASTARAALVDDDVRAQLTAGRLVGEHELAGFGFGEGDLAAALETSPPRLSVVPDAVDQPDQPDEPDEPTVDPRVERAGRLRDKADDLTARADDLDAQATEAEAVAAKLRRTANRAIAAATSAERRAEQAESELADDD